MDGSDSFFVGDRCVTVEEHGRVSVSWSMDGLFVGYNSFYPLCAGAVETGVYVSPPAVVPPDGSGVLVRVDAPNASASSRPRPKFAEGV